MYITGDFSVNTLTQPNCNLATQEFKNIFSSNFYSPLIHKPTRITEHSATLIDNIYCNVPELSSNSAPDILTVSISDYYAIFSVLKYIIEKIISIHILRHILDNNIVDSFQSAYRAGHSCETTLLRVYNDIVTTVGKGNGSFLVLLDLSAAFDTIDHDNHNVFYILVKYVGIGGSALRLIRSYFSDRTQRVQIDGILSDFASLLCGVPQGSVLRPMKVCLYLLPRVAILRHHNIGYNIYADDT